MGKCFGKPDRNAEPQETSPIYSGAEYTPSREQRKPVNQVKKAVGMGNDVSKQRLDAASKTGIYNITGKESKEFPKDCLKVSNLRVLTLDKCQLLKVPPEISSLAASLQKLMLPNNKLRSLPAELSAFSALQQIDLSGNALESLPDCFAVMQKLKDMTLASNQLTSLPASIGSAKNLKVLDVSNNRLSSLPAAIGDLVNLEDLDCNSNRISSLPDTMGGMKRLKRLNACHNQLAAGAIPGALMRDTPLDSLRIEGNPLAGLKDEDGYAEYEKRAKTHELKNIDQRVRTGDLSLGLGTAEQYAAMHKT
mmetsp:Transcript_20517/g.30114  ORF Transcript_20517/g.30114 Transcript_20517/m.30114 type:complete len:307 (+) Transcript_20517:112-1032(+)